MGQKTTLRANKRRAIEALLTGSTVTEAAEIARVSRQTVHRWLKADDAFQRALARGEREALAELNRGLLRLSDKAIQALEAALDDDEIRTRLKGCDTHLRHLLRYAEIALIEQEISRLEEEREEWVTE